MLTSHIITASLPYKNLISKKEMASAPDSDFDGIP
jgi:hypothetical protein